MVALIWIDYSATTIHLHVWKKQILQLLRQKTIPCSLWKVSWLMSIWQNSWNQRPHRIRHCRAKGAHLLKVMDCTEAGRRIRRYHWTKRIWWGFRHWSGNRFKTSNERRSGDQKAKKVKNSHPVNEQNPASQPQCDRKASYCIEKWVDVTYMLEMFKQA